MRIRKLAAIVPLLFAVLLTAPSAAQDKPATPPVSAPVPTPGKGAKTVKPRVAPVERSAWMFAIGLGYGWGGPKAGDLDPDKETGGTIHGRVGYAAGKKAIVGIEYLQWNASPDTNKWTIKAAGPSVTCYVTKNAYLRGMAGWGSLETSFDAGAPVQPLGGGGTIHIDRSDDGFALFLAAGWDWRWRKHVGFSPEIQFLNVNAGGGFSANVVSASVAASWFY